MNKKKKTKRLYIQSSAYKRNVHIIIIQSGNAVVRMHSSSSSPCHNHRVIHSGIMFVIHRCVAPPCKCSATQITEYCAKSTKKKKKTENTQQRKVHTTRELCQSIPFIPKSYDDAVYMAHMNKLLYESVSD